ncbi:carbohydrate-binding protein [bacterium]|nr:carbohydrate-binding protein [bacterium]
MKRGLLFFLTICFSPIAHAQTDSLIIQEQQLGLCTYNGSIVTTSGSITGWTGPGFIDVENGAGKAASWEIAVQTNGEYLFTWRYAFGGTETNLRDAVLLIDGNAEADTVHFPYTGSWSDWAETTPVPVQLAAGDHQIRLEAVHAGGLANLDYFKVYGTGIAAHECTPQYTFRVTSNDSSRGTVSCSPVRPLYDTGTPVTIRASAKPGYFFQSWTGDEPSADSVFTFAIKGDAAAVARFLPESIRGKIDTTIIGYATVQDDKGTPYLVTGGAGGGTVQAATLEELQNHLGSPSPLVVQFSGELVDSAVISIRSDKMLQGIGPAAHLVGIELSINGARNVIIRDMKISRVRDGGATNDAMSISGAAKNIVVDHCEFYSDREHDKDYYDGLLDIKNQSSFITVSNCFFHDHWKTMLISSGDTQVADSLIRVTLHHNYFHNCSSRMPLIRFGRTHLFNNYYKDCDDAINTRMGACVRVERNYFDNVDKAVFSEYSPVLGFVQLIDNHFGCSNAITEPVCEFLPPYPYTHRMHAVDVLPALVPALFTTIADQNGSVLQPRGLTVSQNFPNPFNPATVLIYQLPHRMPVTVELHDVTGRKVATLAEEIQSGENRIECRGDHLPGGVYFLSVQAGNSSVTKKIVLLK